MTCSLACHIAIAAEALTSGLSVACVVPCRPCICYTGDMQDSAHCCCPHLQHMLLQRLRSSPHSRQVLFCMHCRTFFTCSARLNSWPCSEVWKLEHHCYVLVPVEGAPACEALVLLVLVVVSLTGRLNCPSKCLQVFTQNPAEAMTSTAGVRRSLHRHEAQPSAVLHIREPCCHCQLLTNKKVFALYTDLFRNLIV